MSDGTGRESPPRARGTTSLHLVAAVFVWTALACPVVAGADRFDSLLDEAYRTMYSPGSEWHQSTRVASDPPSRFWDWYTTGAVLPDGSVVHTFASRASGAVYSEWQSPMDPTRLVTVLGERFHAVLGPKTAPARWPIRLLAVLLPHLVHPISVNRINAVRPVFDATYDEELGEGVLGVPLRLEAASFEFQQGRRLILNVMNLQLVDLSTGGDHPLVTIEWTAQWGTSTADCVPSHVKSVWKEDSLYAALAELPQQASLLWTGELCPPRGRHDGMGLGQHWQKWPQGIRAAVQEFVLVACGQDCWAVRFLARDEQSACLEIRVWDKTQKKWICHPQWWLARIVRQGQSVPTRVARWPTIAYTGAHAASLDLGPAVLYADLDGYLYFRSPEQDSTTGPSCMFAPVPDADLAPVTPWDLGLQWVREKP